ncbi:N-acetyl-D-Glu racemase DgcA [Croceibacterium sp. TMG7-5b_MA50]|uniref:N-acetyl-D-Glu racemase DgcA n=1 Tax=Croceibacterium sp. TMG7-5b_MA50 TaxID=3121290 RepID=UPI0032214FC4
MRTVQARAESFPLARPFRISRGTTLTANVVAVTVTENGHTGFGECVPYTRYRETVESTLAAIAGVRGALEAGAGRAELLTLLPAGAARNALDCALWDLEAQGAGQGLLPTTPIATALTVTIDTPDKMAEQARALAGVPLIKVKLDRDMIAERLAAVRGAAPGPRLIVDPNESWTIAEVEGLQGVMQEQRVDLLEQPLPAGDDTALQDYTGTIPIAADESVHIAADLATLPRGYSVVNIKLDKAGGLTAALELADAAEAAGYTLMTGCMVCSSLSIAPAMLPAARSRFVDLDGPVWLLQDRPGGVTVTDGMLHPPAPGFWGGGQPR